MKNPTREREVLRERLENGERGGSDADREVLIAFDDAMELIPSDKGDHRAVKLLRHCTIMSEGAGPISGAIGPGEDPETGEKSPEKEQAEEIVRWIHANYDNENTNADYRRAIRLLGKHTTEGDDVPGSLEWIPTSTSNTHDPTPDPEDMLTREEVDAMMDACFNNRDRALIAVAFEAGPEPGSLYELTIAQLLDGDHGYKLSFNGRHGKHYPSIIESVPYVNRWLADHPNGEDPNAPVWSKLDNNERISYHSMLKALKQAAKRAGVKKPVTPRNFRKSNASWLARRGFPESLINQRQGRKPGSPVIQHYVARDGPDNAEKAYARELGLEVKDDHDMADRTPITCPRCYRDTPRNRDACMFCHHALGLEAAERIRQDERDLRRAVLKLAKEKPSLTEQAVGAADLMDLFQSDPDLRETVKSFTDALEGS